MVHDITLKASNQAGRRKEKSFKFCLILGWMPGDPFLRSRTAISLFLKSGFYLLQRQQNSNRTSEIVVSNYPTRETSWPRLLDVDTSGISAPPRWGDLMGT